MKSTCYALLALLIYGCNQASKHPQAGLTGPSASTEMNEKSILHFADSIDHRLQDLDLHTSMIYMNENSRLYVDRYSLYGKPALFVEHSEEGNAQNTLRKYYFKNDSLIFVYARKTNRIANEVIISDERSYFRNNILFKTEQRSAETAEDLKTMSYTDTIKKSENAPTVNERDKIDMLVDAAAGQNQFKMVFDQLSNYSNGIYIVLKSSEQNSYITKVLVKQRDALIDSLETMPGLFKGEKLHFTWKIEDNEAIYVPDKPGVTSARGLNR